MAPFGAVNIALSSFNAKIYAFQLESPLQEPVPQPPQQPPIEDDYPATVGQENVGPYIFASLGDSNGYGEHIIIVLLIPLAVNVK